jgi:hypothetical protein
MLKPNPINRKSNANKMSIIGILKEGNGGKSSPPDQKNLTKMLQNATPCLSRPNGVGGDECSDFKKPIGRTFLSGHRIFAETGKSRLSVKLRL